MKPYRKIVIDNDTRLGDSDTHDEGDDSEDDSTTRRSNMNKSSLLNTEHESTLSNRSSHGTLRTSSEVAGGGNLESIFEQDLNLLFATKVKVTSYTGKKGGVTSSAASSRVSSAGQQVRRRTSGNMKILGSKDLGEGEDSEELEGGSSDRSRSRSLSTMGSQADIRTNAIRLANQKNLNAIIEKMKAMGVYSDTKFNRRSSSMGTSSDEQQRKETRGLIVEGTASFSRSQDPDHQQSRGLILKPGGVGGSSKWVEANEEDDIKAKEKYLELLKSKINNIGNRQTDSFDSDDDAGSTFDPTKQLKSLAGGVMGGEGSLLELSTARSEGPPTPHSASSIMDDSIFSYGYGSVMGNADGNANPLARVPPNNPPPAFLTQHLADLQLNVEDSTQLSIDMMHRIGNRRPNLLPPEPTNVTPLIMPGVYTRPSTREKRPRDPLQGRWHYDINLEDTEILSSEILARLRNLKEKQRKEEHVRQQRERRKQQRRDREILHLPTNRDIYKEIVFNAETCQLCLLIKEGEMIQECIAVDLDTIYITSNPSDTTDPIGGLGSSTNNDMVFVKTTDTDQVKNGYLGSFPMQQWVQMEEEMNQSMVQLMTAKKARTKRMKDRKMKKLQSVIQQSVPSIGSPTAIAAPSNGAAVDGGVSNAMLGELSMMSALTNEESSVIIPNIQPQALQMSFLDKTNMSLGAAAAAAIGPEADNEEVQDKYITIPRYHGKRDDLPFTDPPVHSERYMEMKRQIMMTYQSDKLHFTRQKRLERMLEQAMKTIRVHKPKDKVKVNKSPKRGGDGHSRSPSIERKAGKEAENNEYASLITSSISAVTEYTPEPHRYHDLLPTVAAKHWTKQKRPQLAGQEDESMIGIGDDGEEPFHSMIAEKGTMEVSSSMVHGSSSDWQSSIANSLTMEQLQELKQSTFNLANQVIPLTPLPPILQPAAKNHGYDASGFVACNQPVSFTIKGFTPTGSMFSPTKPPDRPGPTQKSFRTGRLSVNFSDSSLLSSLPEGAPSGNRQLAAGGSSAESLSTKQLSAQPQRLSPVLAMEAETQGAASDVRTQDVAIPAAALAAVEGVKKSQGTDIAAASHDLSDNAVIPPSPEKLKFSYEYQIILLVETRRIMQVCKVENRLF